MDAITLLKDDHRAVEKLFKRFEKAGPKAYVEKREIADRIIEELSKHAAIEEMLFYPVTRATVPETDDVVLESLEEHHVAKWLLSEIEKMDPENERFDAKVTVLIENVRHHVEEEETEYFPKVRDELGRKALGELGDAMADAKKSAPTHPHPRSPQTPPGNLVAGPAAGMVDRVTDTVGGVAQGGAELALQAIARVTGSKRPKKSATGSSVARKAAAKVQASVEEARDTGEQVTKKALRKAEKTADAGKAGAKGTATSAKKAAASTTKAAKAGAKGTATSARKTTSSSKPVAQKAVKTTKTTAKRATSTTANVAKAGAKTTKATAKRAATTTKKAAKR